jgi:cytochrome c oxidase subunit 3
LLAGAVFVGSQAWEWKNFIQGEYGAVETKGGQILQFVTAESGERVTSRIVCEFATNRSFAAYWETRGLWFVSESALPTYSVAEVQEGFLANPDLLIKTEMIDPATGHKIVLGSCGI